MDSVITFLNDPSLKIIAISVFVGIAHLVLLYLIIKGAIKNGIIDAELYLQKIRNRPKQ